MKVIGQISILHIVIHRYYFSSSLFLILFISSLSQILPFEITLIINQDTTWNMIYANYYPAPMVAIDKFYNDINFGHNPIFLV